MQIFDIPINSKRMETTRIGTFDFPLAVHKNDLKMCWVSSTGTGTTNFS